MKKQLSALFCLLFLAAFLIPFAGAGALKDTFEQASAAFSKGDYDAAISLFQQSIDLRPDFAPAYNYLGLAKKEKGGNLKELVPIFQKAIELDPHYADAHNNLGKVYYGLGQFDKAKEETLKALEINPALTNAKLSLAWIHLLGKSQPREAIVYFNQVVKEDANIPYAYFGLGMAYFMNHQKPLVLEMITKLRLSQQEDLAKKLEDMIRDNTYVAIAPEGSPLVMPVRQAGTLVSNVPEPSAETVKDKPADMPVRLKTKTPSSDEMGESNYYAQQDSSGVDKVRSMQRSNTKSSSYPSSIGSGY